MNGSAVALSDDTVLLVTGSDRDEVGNKVESRLKTVKKCINE